MATIIDALVLELDLDPTKFNEKQKKAVAEYSTTVDKLEENNKKLRERNEKVAGSFDDVAKSIGKMVVGYLSVGAITSYITNTTQANVATGQLATTLGIAVERLSQYRQAARLANISPDAITGTIQSSTNNLNSAAAGQLGGNFWSSYGKLGVQGQLLDQSGKPIPVEEYLRRVQDAVRRTQASGRYSSGQITSFLGDLGINQETAYVLESTNHGLDKFLEISKKIGPQTTAQFESSDKLLASWNALATSANSLGRAILDGLSPALTFVLETIGKIVDGIKWIKEFGDKAPVREVNPAEPGSLTDKFNKWWWNGNPPTPGVSQYRQQQSGNTPQAGSNQVAPGTSGAGGGGQQGGIDRSRFKAELDAKPWLREKIMGISAGENNHPNGNVAVMETLMNRAAMLGTTLEHEAKTTSEGGYYAGYQPGAVPGKRGFYEGNLNKVLNGSNVSNYATDNASSWLADKYLRTGVFEARSGRGTPIDLGGETYFAPGTRDAGRGRNRANYERWRQGLVPKEWGANTSPIPWLGAPPPGANLHNQSTTIQNHSSIDIGNINVATQARNASDLASGLEGHMRQRFKTIQATTGLA